MTVVIAVPELIAEMRRIVQRGAAGLRRQGLHLNDALVAFFATRSEFGPRSSSLPGAIAAEARILEALEVDLADFVNTLLLADAAGATRMLGAGSRMARAVLIIDEAVLRTYTPIDSATTVRDLVERLRREHADHGRAPARQRPSIDRDYIRWRVKDIRQAGQIRQLETSLDPPHRSWGHVDRLTWTSASSYLETTERGRAMLADRTSMGPFTTAAVVTGATLSSRHLAVLDRLDELAQMPLEAFIAARSSASLDDPWFDWTSDGCSGPIPPGAAETCLRHDFLYRNGRMLRDQWGLDAAFAREVKQHADDAFGQELEDSYPDWVRALAPPLEVWIDAAELAVAVAGDVSEPWNPPPAGRFYGSENPQR